MISQRRLSVILIDDSVNYSNILALQSQSNKRTILLEFVKRVRHGTNHFDVELFADLCDIFISNA